LSIDFSSFARKAELPTGNVLFSPTYHLVNFVIFERCSDPPIVSPKKLVHFRIDKNEIRSSLAFKKRFKFQIQRIGDRRFHPPDFFEIFAVVCPFHRFLDLNQLSPMRTLFSDIPV